MSWHQLIGPLHRVVPSSGLAEWYAGIEVQAQGLPLEQAFYGGRIAATSGRAFLAGYQAALRALWPEAPEGLGAFCTTENRKLRPAEMVTRAQNCQVNGSKDFVTAGSEASWLLVSAREENGDEPPRLGMYAVQVGCAGVHLAPGQPLPVIPDIPHARVHLEQAKGIRLNGDGWRDYVVPFRSFEDLYVLVALSAWLYGVGLQLGWPDKLALRLLALTAGAAEASRKLSHDPASHVLLAGLIEQFDSLQPELDSAFGADDELAAAWRRDRVILGFAREAKARRLQKAMAALGMGNARNLSTGAMSLQRNSWT